MAPAADRTLVAMSGGVDSAVAALLVTREGAQAVGVTLELWSDQENDGEASCCSAQAVRGAREVAHGLGMAHLSIDLRAEFRAGVVEHWLSDHEAGETPNPCVRCNGNVRLDAMLELAERLGAQTLATGHYARVDQWPARSAVANGGGSGQGSELRAGGACARVACPLAVSARCDAQGAGARAGGGGRARGRAKRDSQDLCFLAGTRQGAFLERHGGLGERTGKIVDRQGRVLGEHAGAHTFTVGQRHGLGIGGGEPLYVLATDTRMSTVTVGPRAELLSDGVRVREVTLHRDGGCVDGVKVRSRGRRLECRLAGEAGAGRHEHVSVELKEPAERTAPGQFACLYAGDVIVGHGTVAA